MAQKVVLVADPGIDTAFAVALALHDPDLDVLGLMASRRQRPGRAGRRKTSRRSSTQLDPPTWPRLGGRPAGRVRRRRHRACTARTGSAASRFPCVEPAPADAGDKVIVELVREHPREVTVICLGPVTVAGPGLRPRPGPAGADRPARVPSAAAWHEPGNAGAGQPSSTSTCDPAAARRVIKSGLHPLLVPLDVTRKLIFSPTDLLELPNPESRARASSCGRSCRSASGRRRNLYGIEGFHLKDVLGVAAVALPGSVTAEEHVVDVETKGELTRGMMVVDARKGSARPNALVGVDAAIGEISQYVARILKQAP